MAGVALALPVGESSRGAQGVQRGSSWGKHAALSSTEETLFICKCCHKASNLDYRRVYQYKLVNLSDFLREHVRDKC